MNRTFTAIFRVKFSPFLPRSGGGRNTGLLMVLAILLSGTFSLGGVQISNGELVVETDRIRARFSGSALVEFTNLITQETYLENSGSQWLIIREMDQEENIFLIPEGWRIAEDPELGQVGVNRFANLGREVTLKAGIDRETDEVILRISGKSSDTGVVSVFWGIEGVHFKTEKLIIPGQAGSYFNLQSDQAAVALDYPVHWESQMVLYETDQGGFMFFANDEKALFKRILASRETGNLDFGVEMFALAPWINATKTPEIEWRFHAFRGDWRSGAARYRDWMRGVWPPDDSPARSWTQSIMGVVTVFQTDKRVVDRLRETLVPEKTMIYLVDWRRDPYDTNYPDYTPNEQLIPFVEYAHEHGFRVMLHMNALGVSTTHPKFKELRRFQIRDADDLNPLYWPFGLWPSHTPPEHIQGFAFISPAASEYRRLYIEILRQLIEETHIDAVHMDAGGVLLNDGNGLIEGMTVTEGMIRLQTEILEEFPNLVIGSESTTEALAPHNRFAQRWGADSPPHPISTFLLGDQVTFYGFLDQPLTEEPEFIDYIRRYEGIGVMATPIVRKLDDLNPDRTGMNRLLKLIRVWQDLDLVPDWSSLFPFQPVRTDSENPGTVIELPGYGGPIVIPETGPSTSEWSTIFRFGNDSGIRAVFEKDKNLVRLRIGSNPIYIRVHGAKKVVTPFYIPSWPAFNDDELLGLNPTAEYWLDVEPTRPDNMVHLTKLPPNVRIGPETIITSDFALFDLKENPSTGFDFIKKFDLTRKGTIYNRRDYLFSLGAVAELTRLSINGEVRPVFLTHPPFERYPNGAVFFEYAVNVPEYENISLDFEVALADIAVSGPIRSDGVTLAVWIDGVEHWRDWVLRAGWNPGRVDLSAFAGQTIKIRFITHSGPRMDTTLDWAVWSNVEIKAEGIPAPAEFEVSTPGGRQPLQVYGGEMRSDSEVLSSVPENLLFFLEPGSRVEPGEYLMDHPYVLHTVYNHGLPSPSQIPGNGQQGQVKSNDEIEERALVALPPSHARTVISFPLRLSSGIEALSFRVGMADGPPPFPKDVNYSGVVFEVRVNGKHRWSREVDVNGWIDGEIDLKQWRNQNVLIQLVTDANGIDTFDWSHWADLTVY